MTESNISDEMRAAIGRVYEEKTSFPIAASDVRKWAVAVYHPGAPPAVHVDEAYARSLGNPDVVVPQEFNPFAWYVQVPLGPERVRDFAPDDVEDALGVKGPGLASRLNGGYDTFYGEPMQVGDVITSAKRLVSYAEKSGRLGLMLFTVIEDSWTRADGRLVKRTEQTSIRY